jgi:hypothetical protein
MRRRRGLDAPWLALPIFGGIGALFVCTAIVAALLTLSQHASYVATQGQVIGFDYRGNSRTPVVLYDAPGLESAVITGTVYSSLSRYAVEDRIGVRYPPDDPANGIVDDPLEKWLLPGIFGFIGTIFCVIGYGIWRTGG